MFYGFYALGDYILLSNNMQHDDVVNMIWLIKKWFYPDFTLSQLIKCVLSYNP